MKNILKKLVTGSLIMLAVIGLMIPMIAQATDETVTIDKEEYAEYNSYKEYQDYKRLKEKYGENEAINKNENTEKEYKKYNDNPVEIETISEDEYNEEIEDAKIKNLVYCIIFFLLAIINLILSIRHYFDDDFEIIYGILSISSFAMCIHCFTLLF